MSSTPDPRSDEPCKHWLDDCPICGADPQPYKPTDTVYVTEYGTVYHYRRDCPALEYGQQLVEERGGTPSPVESVPESLAKLDRSPCRRCKPGSKHNPK